jgi:peptide-methionine (R)-S-oxide reductase
MLVLLSACKSKEGVNTNATSSTESRSNIIPTDSLPYFVNAHGDKITRIIKSDQEWKASLNEAEYYVLRKKGTERPFTSELLKDKGEGIYTCKACGYGLFRSQDKFDSGTGWPSFFRPIEEEAMHTTTDYDIGYPRTEVMCARCRSHLGHVFDDGPKPTGLRYCINGVSLNFVEQLTSK